jgi:integrase
MGLSMPTPWKHPKTGMYWLRRRVPRDLISLVGRQMVQQTLGTKEPAQAKIAFAKASAALEERWSNLRSGVKTLSEKEAVGIAGELYRELVATNGDNPGPPDSAKTRLFIDQITAGDPTITTVSVGAPVGADLLKAVQRRYRPDLEAYFADRGELIAPESFDLVLIKVNQAMVQGREQLLRMAHGDYRPDPNADRFPVRGVPPPGPGSLGGGDNRFELVSIYERYADESKHAASTRKKWRSVIREVAAEVPDIRSLNADWCLAWKNRLIARRLTNRTIKFGRLAALSATCDWAVQNQLIAVNPVSGVKLKIAKSEKKTRRGYTRDEAAKVLTGTLQEFDGKFSKETLAARRWVPWLCAYTGARVGEIAQLRREDIRHKAGVWMIWITPEAGTVKDANSRFVPVHPHLIEQGFVDFVDRSSNGPLFYNEGRRRGGSDENPLASKVGERLAAWIRSTGLTDPELAPNHAWRHRFKTLARKHGIDTGARDYMQGHVTANEAENYGEFEPDVLLREISKLPRYEVKGL